jgi:hypothetical protein
MSMGYKVAMQLAFMDSLTETVGTGSKAKPYYMEFLSKLKDEALNPNSRAAMFIADRLVSSDIIDQLDSKLQRAKREDLDFIAYRAYRSCFDIQQQILMSRNRNICIMAGRRSGKSEVIKKKIAVVLATVEDAKIIYIGKTMFTAIEQIYNGVTDILSELGQTVEETRRNEGYIKLDNGSELYIRGNNTTEDREKLRGFRWDLAVIDEAQSQRALSYLIDHILEPALVDRQGQLILAGTGPRVGGTYWEDIFTRLDSTALRLNWNITQNVFIPNYEELLEQIKAEKNLTDASPLYQREYLGKICYDTDSLVYRLTDQNYYTDDQLQAWVQGQPPSDLRLTAGLDYGFIDSDAFVIVLFSISRPERWVVFEHKGNRTGVTELADAMKAGIAMASAAYPQAGSYNIYADTGGGTKKISYELMSQYGLPVQDAYKANKDMAVEILQDEVRRGVFKAKRDSIFADESLKTVFARNERDELTRIIDDDTYHPDLLDAILYGMRFVWVNYAQK